MSEQVGSVQGTNGNNATIILHIQCVCIAYDLYMGPTNTVGKIGNRGSSLQGNFDIWGKIFLNVQKHGKLWEIWLDWIKLSKK